MFCSKCGVELYNTDKTCPHCGTVNEGYVASPENKTIDAVWEKCKSKYKTYAIVYMIIMAIVVLYSNITGIKRILDGIEYMEYDFVTGLKYSSMGLPMLFSCVFYISGMVIIFKMFSRIEKNNSPMFFLSLFVLHTIFAVMRFIFGIIGMIMQLETIETVAYTLIYVAAINQFVLFYFMLIMFYQKIDAFKIFEREHMREKIKYSFNYVSGKVK